MLLVHQEVLRLALSWALEPGPQTVLHCFWEHGQARAGQFRGQHRCTGRIAGPAAAPGGATLHRASLLPSCGEGLGLTCPQPRLCPREGGEKLWVGPGSDDGPLMSQGLELGKGCPGPGTETLKSQNTEEEGLERGGRAAVGSPSIPPSSAAHPQAGRELWGKVQVRGEGRGVGNVPQSPFTAAEPGPRMRRPLRPWRSPCRHRRGSWLHPQRPPPACPPRAEGCPAGGLYSW